MEMTMSTNILLVVVLKSSGADLHVVCMLGFMSLT